MTKTQFFNRAILFIHGNPNIVGCLFGLAGLGLYFYQIIYENWFLIVSGLYLIGYRITPKPPKLLHIYKRQLAPDELLFNMESLVLTVKDKIPDIVYQIVIEIKEILENIIMRIDGIKSDPNSIHLVQQTVVDYLPRILDIYMKIPPAYSRLYKIRDGNTATDIAMKQLHLLKSEINKVSTLIAKKDINELQIHHRFLKTKFTGDIDDWFVK